MVNLEQGYAVPSWAISTEKRNDEHGLPHYRHQEEVREDAYRLGGSDVKHHVSQYTDTYAARLTARQPMAAPIHRPGQLVYSPMTGANVPVCSVRWDSGMGSLPMWYVSTPGRGGDQCNFLPARADKPTKVFMVRGHTWKCVGKLSPGGEFSPEMA